MKNNPLEQIKEGLNTPKDKVQLNMIDLNEVAKAVKHLNVKPFFTPTHIEVFRNNNDTE
ncbi:hypothetical protein [Bacillus sp. X1(2014)]|uniref:hypothetical protein n=1 Tax=Bacillus sp. X1(2014) TaxID=1565991 RepID=UPI0016427880|nr:hypothetical protein [Bacillus sp. X1(2014)]